jgi:hypothetical protein
MAHSKKNWDVKELTKKKKNSPPRGLIPLGPISNFMHVPIVKSHKSFGFVMNRFMLNRLNALFKNNGKVTEFVREERRRRGLDETNITVGSSVYGIEKNNPTLFIVIKKNNIDFIHLSIHLAPEVLGLTIKGTGIVHIVKNIYTNHISIKKYHLIKSMYAVYQPPGKPHSLQFRIAERYTTPELVSKTNKYDDEVKQEMDVLTTVLNQLFDEDDREHYVGDYDAIHVDSNNKQEAIPIESNTDNILRIMNLRTNAFTRKNKGIYFKNNAKSNGGRRNKRTKKRK